MKLIPLLACITACTFAYETAIYTAWCHSEASVTVNATGVARSSTYTDYKALVCRACQVTECNWTALFKGYTERKDSETLDTTSNLEDLTLRLIDYSSYEKNVSYRCPEGYVHTVPCYTNSTLKQCLISQCEQCPTGRCRQSRFERICTTRTRFYRANH